MARVYMASNITVEYMKNTMTPLYNHMDMQDNIQQVNNKY